MENLAIYKDASHTDLVKHLVTLVKNKGLDIAQRQVLVANKGIQTTGGSHNDVGVGLLVGQKLNVLGNGSTTVEHGGLDIREVLGETSVLVLDLVGQFTSVAHDEDGALARNWLQLMKGGQNEDRGLSETRLGLAENIDIENGGRNAMLLDCRKAKRWLDLVPT